MSGGAFLEAAAHRLSLAPTDPLNRLPRTFDERFEAEWSAAFSPDRYFRQREYMIERWGDLIDRLHRATGERIENPYRQSLESSIGAEVPSEDPEAVFRSRLAAAMERTRLAREQHPDLPDPELFGRQMVLEAEGRRDLAASYVGTGNGLGAFAGGLAAETFTPHGLAGFLVPVTRLPTLAAGRTLTGALGNIGREALFQAGANTGIQAGAELLDYAARAPLGTEQTAEEIAMNIGGAFVFGAAFGGAVRGGQLGLRSLLGRFHAQSPEVREAAPRQARDGINVLTRDELDGIAGNPLGDANAWLHEAILERVSRQMLRGEKVQIDDLMGRAVGLGDHFRQTTAIGRLLAATESNPAITVSDIPAADLAEAARRWAPGAHRHFDEVSARSEAIGRTLAEIPARKTDIAIARVVGGIDEASGEILADIDARLAGDALPAASRADLERQKAQIVESFAADDLKAERERQWAAAKEDRKRLTAEQTEIGPKLERAQANLDAARANAAERAKDVVAELRASLPSGRQIDLPTFAARVEDRLAPLHRPAAPPDSAAASPAEVAETTKAALKNRKLDEALKLRLAETIEKRPDLAVPVVGADGVEHQVSIKQVMAELDKQEGDVNAALGCILGGLL